MKTTFTVIATTFLLVHVRLAEMANAEEMPPRFAGLAVLACDKGRDWGPTDFIYGFKHALSEIGDELFRVKSVAAFKNGKQHGPEVIYHDYEEGVVHEIRHYVGGKQNGSVIVLDKKGTIIASAVYRDGEPWSGTTRGFYHEDINNDGVFQTAGYVVVEYKDGKQAGSTTHLFQPRNKDKQESSTTKTPQRSASPDQTQRTSTD